MAKDEAVASSARQIRPWAILKVIAAAVGAYLIAAGFDFTTPAKRFQSMDGRIGRVEARVDTLDARLTTGLGTLLKLSCLDASFSDRDRQLAGLDCNAVLRTRGAK